MTFQMTVSDILIEELDRRRLDELIREGNVPSILRSLKESSLTHGSYMTSPIAYTEYPVVFAAKLGKVHVMNALISAGFSPHVLYPLHGNVHLRMETTPLHEACENGRLPVVQCLIKEHGVSINCKNSRSWTPLRVSLQCRQTNVVKFLVTEGADLNEGSILKAAVRNCNLDMCEYLVNQGADVNVKDSHGKTALWHCVACGDLQKSKLFLNYGANVDACDFQNKTPFFLACVEGHLEVLRFLIKGGANPEHQDSKGNTSLHYVVGTGSTAVTEYLVLELNVCLDILNWEGRSAIGRALHGVVGSRGRYYSPEPDVKRCRKTVWFLLKAGARVSHDVTLQNYLKQIDAITSENNDLRNDEIFNYIHRLMTTPRTLSELCCFTIRHLLGRRLTTAVDQLHVPVKVKDYIKLTHLKQYIARK